MAKKRAKVAKKQAEVETCPRCGEYSTPYGEDDYDLVEGGSFKRLQLCCNSKCRAVFLDIFTLSYDGQIDDEEVADVDEYNEYVDKNGDPR